MAGEMQKIKRQLQHLLEIEEAFGVEGFRAPEENPQDALRELSKEARNCKKCPLHRGRKHVVFGEGNPHAKLLFIGEAPGEEEDLTGRPFCGRSGELLTKIIQAMGLSREEVYITSCIKCRPPLNRAPKPEELGACRPYLIGQIDLIKPRLITALGNVAACNLSKTDNPITEIRGKFFDYQGIKVMPTFHPAYLLRNPNAKRLVWEDMKKVLNEIRTGGARSAHR